MPRSFGSIDVSVVVRSKDEAPRLRLTLAALSRQSVPVEVVVVDDGSTDDTQDVIREASRHMRIEGRRHATSLGRSASSNAGAAAASAELLLFMDGDVLAAPDMVARHLHEHRLRPNVLVRGETWHLRQTRFFRDPEIGAPMADQVARVAAMTEPERTRALVTRRQIENDFSTVAERAQPGIYPGAGPRGLYDLEIEALSQDTDSDIHWAAACGHNLSVRREAFQAVGGFDPEISLNEHRKLAFELGERGVRLTLAKGARSYHMTHQRGWRDPLADQAWLERFYRHHPHPAVALLPVFWDSLSDASATPPDARIGSLAELRRAALALENVVGVKAVQDAHVRHHLRAPAR